MENYSGIDNLKVMQDAQNYNLHLLSILLPGTSEANVVMDFGAGLGTFACSLRNRVTRMICIESDDKLLFKLQNDGFEAYSSLDSVPPCAIDYIYTVNVLEHVDDDSGLLLELYRRLRPGGLLVIYVPAFQLLYSTMDRKVGHKRRYTKSGLIELIQSVGFTIEGARYIDSLGFVAALMFKLLGNKKGDINVQGLKLFDKYVFPISMVLDGVCCRFIGKNVMVRAHRPKEESEAV